MDSQAYPTDKITFPFDNSYFRELPGLYIPHQPEQRATPQLLYFNSPLADELLLKLPEDAPELLAALFTGNLIPEGAEPIAQAYAGHQFGHFSPQLGDGRALILGEVLDKQQQRYDICFKGSGRTPFSRNGDGKAAIGPMLREVLVGEAMHALGIPTTRALAVTATGEQVVRDKVLPGSVLTRVASSHIRIGTFQYFAARGQQDYVKKLADYTIARHYAELIDSEDCYLNFLAAVSQKQATLIAQWMSVGFIHGVMNTDNMTISGETIDYGPCAFMDSYKPDTVFSSIDEHGRYAYGNQPLIAQWNLARLAETLLSLIHPEQSQAIAAATEVIESFPELYQHEWQQKFRAKAGLTDSIATIESDSQLISDWLDFLHAQNIDFTLAFRYLADAAEGKPEALLDLASDPATIKDWLTRWQQPDAKPTSHRATHMRKHNPLYIPRNHLVEEALNAASQDNNLTPFENLLDTLKHPYQETPDTEQYKTPASDSFTSCYRTFCGT